ncbi:CHAD domain-containing protein [Sulfurimonas sp. HSL-1716]|uniref:CHAD domain-containing protein n=1 Tax=Hydrocurvibacter sulfurireducens TaxID=3131937 RepID=UPI0031F87E70
MKFEKSFKNKMVLAKRLYKKLHLDNDIELLHRYRVNLRKIYAYSEIYGKKTDKKRALNLSALLKKLLKPTSSLRDLDLFLAEIDSIDCAQETKEKLRKIFAPKRNKKFLALLRDKEYKRSVKELKSLGKSTKILIRGIEKASRYEIIKKSAKNVYKRFAKIDHKTSLHELHKLRIAFKKFRYALDAYEKHLDKEDKALKKVYDLKELQDSFGNIQDNSKRLQLINRNKKQFTKEQLSELQAYFNMKIRDAKEKLFALIKK